MSEVSRYIVVTDDWNHEAAAPEDPDVAEMVVPVFGIRGPVG